MRVGQANPSKHLTERFLSLATHLILFFLFVGIVIHVGWLSGVVINQFTLPITFGLYIVITLVISKIIDPERFISRLKDIGIFAITAVLIAIAGIAIFSHTYDTSYDGQSYHQSAISSMMHGWNPMRDMQLPQPIIQGEIYVHGYPKLYWEFYASFAKMGDSLDAATVLNIIPFIVALVCVYYLLSSVLRLDKWALPLTLLGVVSIYFAQQVFSFMADGTSYEFGIAAIALLAAMFITKKAPLKLIIPFVGLLIILLAIKFNNAPLVIILSLFGLLHFYKTRAYQNTKTLAVIGSAIVCAFLVLWSPFITNYTRHGSPIYPMNLLAPKSNLRYDNIPSNIRKADSVQLLFYGIFSSTQPSSAGDVKSLDNVAMLKLPFTFTARELESTDDFLGRVGSGGVLFSGAVVASILLFVIMLTKLNGSKDEKIIGYIILCVSILIVLGLVNPVANKLRYAPFITLLPLLIVIGSLLITRSKDWLIAATRWVVVITIVANIFLFSISIISQRMNEFDAINKQDRMLQTAQQPIGLISRAFSSIAYRLDERGIKYKIVTRCHNDEHGVEVASSFKSAYYCINIKK
jgi:hypothetical protein